MTAPSSNALQRTELKTTGYMATIFALRMFGLFMILPIFAVYGQSLEGATPLLIGTAIGAYGLMQAILQIPFGMMSDHFGRRPLLLVGLLLFIAGGAVAAMSDHIYGVIAGRALQGAGAIASVIMALIGDVVSEKNRTRAMALIGMSVGGSFILALILGPLLAAWLGLSGLFWATSVLGGLALLVAFVVPAPKALNGELLPAPERFRRVLGNTTLLRFDVGIFTLHVIMTASFVVVPALLTERLGLGLQSHSLLYLGVLVAGFVAMVPLVIRAERRGAVPVKRLAIVLMIVSQLLLALAGAALWHYVLALLVFFAGFNLLEALLPSLVGRAAPAGTRGTAMGVYSSSQFMGVFVGGQLGGALYQWLGPQAVFYACMALACIWLLLLTGMRELPRLENRVLAFQPGQDWLALSHQLHRIPGVEEVVLVEEQGMVLLKVDSGFLDESQLQGLAAVTQS